jgi:hypothetical protein
MKFIASLLACIALATTAVLADPVGDITAANAKFSTVKSYRTTFTQPDGKTMQVETINPDRTHVISPQMEMISIADTVYMRFGGRAWQKVPPSLASTTSNQASLQKLYGNLPTSTVVRDLGMKTVDGDSLHAYSVQRPNEPVSTLYIGADGLPSRVEVTTARGTMSMHVYDYNAPITIVAPN